jgi:hypothetical protein
MLLECRNLRQKTVTQEPVCIDLDRSSPTLSQLFLFHKIKIGAILKAEKSSSHENPDRRR